MEGLLWLAVALNFLAQFGTLGSILNFGAGPADTWGLVSFVGMAVILFSGGLIAWAGARFFQDTRRQQDLELLLTTPLGSRHILGGQWCVLRRALAWPLGVVLVVALPAGISLLYDFANGYHREFWTLLQPFLIAVNLALEAVALCWVGMRFGLHGRNAITAVAGTVGLVQLLPLALSVALDVGLGLAAGSSVVPGHVAGQDATRNSCPAVLRGEEPGAHRVGADSPAPRVAPGEADGATGRVSQPPGPAARMIRCHFSRMKLVNVQVMLARVVPGIIVAHAVGHQFAEVLRVGIPHADGAVEGGLDARGVEVVEDIAVALVIGPLGVVGVEHGVRQAARRAHDGHGAVLESDHLGQAARLEQAGDDDHFRPGIDQVGEFLVEAKLEVTVGVVVVMLLEVPEMVPDAAVRAGSQQHELAAVLQAVMDGVGDERHAFLLIQPADVADDGLEHIPQPEPLPQRLLVLVLVVEGVDAVLARDVAVDFRVPDLVIDAIEDAADLGAMDLEGMAQPEVLGRVHDLPGVMGRNRGDEIGIDDARLSSG